MSTVDRVVAIGGAHDRFDRTDAHQARLQPTKRSLSHVQFDYGHGNVTINRQTLENAGVRGRSSGQRIGGG